jgi:Flp pilus assembly protein TadG
MRWLPKLFRFGSDRRGIAAVEFAFIAPTLIFLVVGVLEMSFRFRAGDEATRYTHQVADLIARDNSIQLSELSSLYGAAPYMMKPLETAANLDLDITSIGFEGDPVAPTVYWRRVGGSAVTFVLADAKDMGAKDETVIRVGIRYRYESVVSKLFGGGNVLIEREAYARPRMDRIITIDGQSKDDGVIKYFTPAT